MKKKAMVRKKFQNPKGGLNDAGRAFYNNQGSHLKKPQNHGARHNSFCARMAGVKGPMERNGQPTRKALALRKWHCK